MSQPVRMFIGMPFGDYSDKEFEPVGLLRVETERSVWFVSGDRYQRIPREERPRAPERSIDGRLTDARWHGLRRCWWREHSDGESQLRLLPAVGPADGVGVVSGVVVAVQGEWVPSGQRADVGRDSAG